MLQRSGGSGKPPNNRGAVSLKSQLKVQVPGKKNLRGSLDSKIVNLISDKENLDESYFIGPEMLKNGEGTHVPVGECI